MLFSRKWLNAIGLFFNMIGVAIIFLWGPPQPSFERGTSLSLEDANVLPDGKTVAQHNIETAAKETHYKRISEIGLVFIFIGFLFQFFNEFLPKEK